MSRLFQTGFEWQYVGATGYGPEGNSWASGSTIETTVVRSGSASLRCVSNATSAGAQFFFNNALGEGRFIRVYFRKAGNPAAQTTIIEVPDLPGLAVRVHTDGTLVTTWAGSAQGSASAALSNDVWYRIELDVTTTAFTARLDGTQFSTAGGLSASGAITSLELGNTSATNFYFDDIAVNDANGSVHNSWCGSGKVVLLKPTADSQVGSWLDGDAAGTTNLFQSLNNTPPTGAAADTTGTKIVTSDGSGDNSTDEYRPTMQTYTVGGVGASDTINALIGCVAHAEEVSTGTKTGSFRILTNPVDAGFATITSFGGAGGAAGTFPTNWVWNTSTPVENPSVTLGTAPTMALRKTDTGTRQADACAMGMYVDYTPAAVATFKQIGYQVKQAVKRASVY